MPTREHPRLLRKRRLASGASKANPGSAPGSLHQSSMHLPTRISVTAYGADRFTEQADVTDLADLPALVEGWPIVWISVNGLANIRLIEQLGEMFSLNKLLLEDVLDIGHRPKLDTYEQSLFAIVKAATLTDQFESEQISFYVRKNVVIVFQEKSSQRFEQVRARLRQGTGRIRTAGADYLFYALLDEVIDRYFPILDELNIRLQTIEDRIFTRTDPSEQSNGDVIQQIHHAKSDLLQLHRAIYPISDIINMLMRDGTPLVSKTTRSFLKDCYDHAIQANELSQFYRDTATGLMGTYLAYEGHKTNEIVKVLTMVSAVFIPLTLIASIYGMNFENPVPEWGGKYGFAFAIFFMLLMAFIMLLIFNRMGWLPTGWPVNKKKS